MSRLSFRPRPLDIHKKLPVLKSVKDFEDDETPTITTSTRNSLLHRVAAENDNETNQTPSKKSSQEIPTPQFNTVETYERDYTRTFNQTTNYIRGRGARAEIGEFVEYDIDNEDEDWLEEFNNERKIISPEKFETLLFKLEVLDHKARERAGVITPTFGAPIPVLLQFDAAAEALHSLSVRFAVLQSVYNYWKAKRERWQKPILRRLQPPPPVNDTNPYNVFRPREKAHRLHTRRMQRRENNVQSFEKLRQVRRSLEQAKRVVEALIKREEKKRELMDCEVNLQRSQLKYKHEALLVEDRMTLLGLQPVSCKFASSDDDYMDSDDTANGHPHAGPASLHKKYADPKPVMVPTVRMKRELKRRPLSNGWLQKRDADEPVMLFTKPLDPDKLSAVGIVQPPCPTSEDGGDVPAHRFHGRIGRGGRIIFDRSNPLLRTSIGDESFPPVSYPRLPPPNG
ncbi:enhancer of polycomb-like protein 1 isoform X1 [Canna indica]|uniref:Enhancer of polycomb-like protein n=1 Tax=Canna indica TaxID=4628 RepID=A0AAQ3Q570_9LILI|nr:enhancer of polycomb-like protein 1 isoform X1 [Canna indica]